jgi:hypothetical protein
MTSSVIARDHQLCELVEVLDAAAETLELIGFPSPDANFLSISLRECFEVKHALEQAADYLAELRYSGGRP